MKNLVLPTILIIGVSLAGVTYSLFFLSPMGSENEIVYPNLAILGASITSFFIAVFSSCIYFSRKVFLPPNSPKVVRRISVTEGVLLTLFLESLYGLYKLGVMNYLNVVLVVLIFSLLELYSLGKTKVKEIENTPTTPKSP